MECQEPIGTNVYLQAKPLNHLPYGCCSFNCEGMGLANCHQYFKSIIPHGLGLVFLKKRPMRVTRKQGIKSTKSFCKVYIFFSVS